MEQSLSDKILHNQKQFTGYRLWDCIHHTSTKFFPEGFDSLMDFTYKTWPNSIAGEYTYKNNFSLNFNENLLKNIISSRITLPYIQDRICIHLRIGDVIKYQNKGQTKQRFAPLEFYEEKFHKITKSFNVKDTPCFLVFGMHYDVGLKESIKYIEDITNLSKQFGMKCALRTSEPDDDFIFLCQSKILISSKSNYFREDMPLVRSCFLGSYLL
jgi:hypothetical protein